VAASADVDVIVPKKPEMVTATDATSAPDNASERDRPAAVAAAAVTELELPPLPPIPAAIPDSAVAPDDADIVVRQSPAVSPVAPPVAPSAPTAIAPAEVAAQIPAKQPSHEVAATEKTSAIATPGAHTPLVAAVAAAINGPRREKAAFAAVSTPVSVPKPAAAVVADESVPKVEPSPAIPAPEQGDLLAANCPVSASHGVDATDVSRPTGQPQAD
jgi:ribonuclease E